MRAYHGMQGQQVYSIIPKLTTELQIPNKGGHGGCRKKKMYNNEPD